MTQPTCDYAAVDTDSPLGTLWTAVSARGIIRISFDSTAASFVSQLQADGYAPAEQQNLDKIASLTADIRAYLSKTSTNITAPVDWKTMTLFQQTVLKQVARIPAGRTATYTDIAAQIGRPTAVRAVGRANATNPIPLIIPCHRVIGQDHQLRGYAGGIERKAWLLRHEGSWLL